MWRVNLPHKPPKAIGSWCSPHSHRVVSNKGNMNGDALRVCRLLACIRVSEMIVRCACFASTWVLNLKPRLMEHEKNVDYLNNLERTFSYVPTRDCRFAFPRSSTPASILVRDECPDRGQPERGGMHVSVEGETQSLTPYCGKSAFRNTGNLL